MVFSIEWRLTVNVVLRDFDVNFQGHTFETSTTARESQRKNASIDFHRGRYSPSNGIIAIAVLHELDLNFQSRKLRC